MTQPHRFINALLRQPVDKTPIWIMRQAGRYLPEYRKIRAQAGSFMALCQNPELACEVTLQPLRRFDLDAAILFSDILTIPDAMGLGLSFVAGEGPKFAHPIRDTAAIKALGVPDPEQELAYVPAAVRLIKQALAGRVPLIGFSGSPWTLATYMVEGQSSKTFSRVKGLLYDEPQAMTQLLATLSDAVVAYLNAQIAAGVDAVMLFDTWGGILSPADYEAFSLAPMRRIIEHLNLGTGADRIPVIVFTKNGGQWLEKIAACGCDAVGLDWTIDIAEARRRVGQQVALQGNLDPAVLYAQPSVITTKAQAILQQFEGQPGHVFNLGHGIHPDVPPEHVQHLVDCVHNYKSA